MIKIYSFPFPLIDGYVWLHYRLNDEHTQVPSSKTYIISKITFHQHAQDMAPQSLTAEEKHVLDVAKEAFHAYSQSCSVLTNQSLTLCDYLLWPTSGFAHKVQQALCGIPCGEVRSYGSIAQQIRTPKSARAVGRVCANNPFPLIIPCHRVVSSQYNPHKTLEDNSSYLGGYMYGLTTKKKLLNHERLSYTLPHYTT
ncbi:MAG: MGMT family protein [Proteobacteria bacterium]|nr:MGMT family protein [Pseudomonadota bacterium]